MYKKFSIEGERDRQPEKSYLAMGVIFSFFFLLSFSFVSAYNFPSTTNSNYITINYTINGSEVLHNDLSDLQGGTSGEYYHFTESQHTSLVSGITNWITNSVDNLVNYYTKTESDLRYAPISEPLAYNGTLAYNSSLSNYYPNSNPNAFINWSQATNGTLAFNSTFSSFVPYTGANQNLNLGNNNFSVNSSTLFVNTNTGNVGIGTASPGAKFSIANVGINGNGLTMYPGEPTGTGGEIIFSYVSNDPRLTLYGSGGTSEIALVTDGNSYLNGGNVGIGTTSPIDVLDISGGGIHLNQVASGPSTSAGAGIAVRNDTSIGAYSLYFRADGYSFQTRAGVHLWDLRSSGDAIFNSGNVGIGTASPSQKLEISKSLGAGEFVGLQVIDTNYSQNIKVGVVQSGSTSRAGIWLNQASPSTINALFSDGGGYSVFNSPATRIAFRIANNNKMSLFTSGGLSLGDTYYLTDPGTNSMIIEGNVGIGTTSPTYKLTVGNGSNTNYSLMSAYFEGNITAAGYITRTSIYDKSGGSALDKIKDASSYLDSKGEINHSALIGYTKWTTDETDYSKPVIENKINEICEEVLIKEATTKELFNEETKETEIVEIPAEYKNECHNETEEVTTYPNTIEVTHEGQNLETQINTLQQAVYELKLDNQNLKERLDKIETETCTIKLFSWCIK